MHDISNFDPRFDYRLTDDDLRFHRWVRPYIPANASRFAAVGQQLDRDFTTAVIRSWPEDTGRVWESEEGRERSEIPLNDRFGIAVERVLEDTTLLDRLPAEQGESLALLRLFVFWLLVNPDRDAVRLADGKHLSEFQTLRDCPDEGVGDSVPDEYVEPRPHSLCQNIKGDVLLVSATSEVSWQAEAWIACARDAAEALGVGPGDEDQQRPGDHVDADPCTAYNWARNCELVRAMRRVFDVYGLSEATVSRGRQSKDNRTGMPWVKHNGQGFISVPAFIEWVKPKLGHPAEDEITQLRNAIIGEICLRPVSIRPPVVVPPLAPQKVFCAPKGHKQ